MSARHRPAALAALLAALLAAPAVPAAASLVPPPGFAEAVQDKASGKPAQPCESPARPFTGDLSFPSKYQGSDAARDDINPKAEAAYEGLTGDIRELERQVSAMTAHYLHSGRPELLDCTLAWLDAWAQAGALTGKADNHTGRSVRKWALATLASSWVRLKFSASRPLERADAQEVRRVDAWLGRLGDLVVADWKDQPRDKINNHQYWAAWAVMADGVALDRRDFFDWAMSQYRFAMGQVDRDGYLPNELKRDTRALAYHNYALGPLALMASFARANGVDVASGRDGEAMRRLAQRTVQGLDDPTIFEKKTGKKQTREGLADPSKFAWMEAYCWTFGCGGDMTARMDKMRPLKTYRLGGNLTEIFAPGALPPKDRDKGRRKGG